MTTRTQANVSFACVHVRTTVDFREQNHSGKSDDWVKLVSSDGYSFLVKRNVATVSGTLRTMLSTDSTFREALVNTCTISERAVLVEKVCEYMAFKAQYESAGPKEEIPLNEFTERIPPEVALELLLAADYLEGEA
ncbi:BTB/POZ protein [Pisolithus orientalis]|uniref:BTB/POZ protein n=1 Tax=Pisolithus orientalis TaxID=936130 RepID=UPI0022253C80|nr:BTB/POZ protein [Pisolithus orientalis]KAI6032680.1 BTB/POZ protein [Pisolithus orientalis]